MVENKRYKLVLIVILLFLILGVGGGLLYYKYVYSRNGIQIMLDTVIDYLNTYFVNSDSIVGNLDVELDIKNEDEKETSIYNIFDELNVYLEYGIDYKNKVIDLEINSKYEDKQLLDFNVYVEKGKSYLYLNNLYDKYIDISNEKYSNFLVGDSNDVKNIYKGLIDAFNNSFKDKYFKVENVVIDGDKLKKTILDLSDSNYSEWLNDFINLLLKDEAFLESYGNIYNLNVVEVKAKFNDTLDNKYNGYKMVIYTKRLNFIKLEIISDKNNFVIRKDNDKYAYELYENNIKVVNGVVKASLKKNKSNILLSHYDEDKKLDMDVKINFFVKLNGKVEKKNINNSVLLEDMGIFEKFSIFGKIIKDEGFVRLIGNLPGMIGQSIISYFSNFIN